MCPTRFPVSRVALAVALRVCGASPMALAVACAGVFSGAWSAQLAAEERKVVANLAVDGRAEWRTIQRDICNDVEHTRENLNDASRVSDTNSKRSADGRADWASAADHSCAPSTGSTHATHRIQAHHPVPFQCLCQLTSSLV